MWIEQATLWITCKKNGLAFLLNIILFRQFQIAQTKAQTSTQIRPFVFLSVTLNQFPNRLLTLVGGGMLYVKCTIR
jgi:hypothetical protein